MKNLILLIILFSSVVFFAKGQNKTSYDVIVTKDQVFKEYRAKARDTVSVNKTTFTYTIFNQGQSDLKGKYNNRWSIALDSVSGTPASVKVEYQRRISIFSTWATDSTQYFYGTQSDTTMIYEDATTKPDPYRRVKVTYASGFVVKIDWLAGVFLKD